METSCLWHLLVGYGWTTGIDSSLIDIGPVPRPWLVYKMSWSSNNIGNFTIDKKYCFQTSISWQLFAISEPFTWSCKLWIHNCWLGTNFFRLSFISWVKNSNERENKLTWNVDLKVYILESTHLITYKYIDKTF